MYVLTSVPKQYPTFFVAIQATFLHKTFLDISLSHSLLITMALVQKQHVTP